MQAKFFSYADDAVEWINKRNTTNQRNIRVISITSVNDGVESGIIVLFEEVY